MDSSETYDAIEGIAIIGMAGRFPGAKNINQFWQNLRDGVESISVFTDEELLTSGIDPETLSDPNYVKAGAVLEDIELFDASFFGFNPREAEMTDPQHRLFLECAWEALESAGYNSETYADRIGTYAGVGWNSYLFNNLYSNSDLIQSLGGYQTLIGNDKDFLATRVSYKLNLKGPSMSVQTGCSTSLVATSLACQSLLTYQCDMALAGGVTVFMPHKAGYFYQQGGIFSPDGHCRAFDAKAQGTVIGNGVGIVVLKRLEDALADGDCIHAVIKSSAINNDGSLKVGYTAPSVEGQARAIAQALALAEVDPETITYIETHGTGTSLGDPIEIAALNQVFRSCTNQKGFCAIGSVKTNIGHLDAAAGVTGLIKTVLALKHKQIPPSLHFKEPNAQIDFANSPFYVNTTLSEWKTSGTPRRAGVSSFGIGGTNAHVILEQAPAVGKQGSRGRRWQLLVLSAKTSTALETATANLANYLEQHPEVNLADVAYTLQVGRRAFSHRRVLVCHDLNDAVKALQTLDPQRILTDFQEPGDRPVVFMFPGQGAQYVNMALELYQTESVFREQVDYCTQLLKPHLGLELRQVMYPSEEQTEAAKQQLEQTWITQPALFVIEYALAKLWMAWGVRPQAMIGHSIGEYVAACLAGVFSLEDTLALVVARGRLMQHLPGGAMLAVSLSEEEVKPLLNNGISLAASNSPKLCVVSGSTEAISVLQNQLTEKGIGCRRLHTSHAFHSQMMVPIVESFTKQVKKFKLKPPQIPFVSNVTGTWITAAEATDPNYWAQHLRQTVRFAQGMAELLKEPNRILLEVGPGRTLNTFARQHLPLDEAAVLSSIRHPKEPQSDQAFLQNTLGRLWLVGVPIDWSRFSAQEQRHRIPLPTYPFERQCYWIKPQKQAVNGQDVTYRISTEHKQLDIAESLQAQKPSNQRNSFSLHTRPNLQNAYVAPCNEVEQTLADIWQELLGVEQIGIHDNFFDLGGDSVLGIQVSARANQAGLRLTPKQLFEYPTIAEIAAVAGTLQPIQAEQGLVTGEVSLTPIQHWFFEQKLLDPHHWNQAVLLKVRQALDPVLLEQAVQQLLVHHDALRLRFEKTESGWQQIIAPSNPSTLSRVDLSALPAEGQETVFKVAATELQASLNLSAGPLLQVTLFDMGAKQPSRLLFVIHHLAVDVLSWRILLEDLQTAYEQLSRGEAIQLPSKTTSFKQWSECLSMYAHSAELQQERDYWQAAPRERVYPLPQDNPRGANTVASARTVSVTLSAEETQTLLQEAQAASRLHVEDILLTALVQTFAEWTGERSLLVDLEGRGREVSFDAVDLSRTVGWFTNIAPVLLDLGKASQTGEALKVVKEQLRSFPNEGVGYGAMRYLSGDTEISEKLRSLPQTEVIFLYLGQLEQTLAQSSLFGLSQEFSGPTRSLRGSRVHLFEINGLIAEGQLRVDWTYSENMHRRDTVEGLAQDFVTALRSLITYCQSSKVENYTPSDFAEFKWSQWSQADLDNIMAVVSKSREEV